MWWTGVSSLEVRYCSEHRRNQVDRCWKQMCSRGSVCGSSDGESETEDPSEPRLADVTTPSGTCDKRIHGELSLQAGVTGV